MRRGRRAGFWPRVLGRKRGSSGQLLLLDMGGWHRHCSIRLGAAFATGQ